MHSETIIWRKQNISDEDLEMVIITCSKVSSCVPGLWSILRTWESEGLYILRRLIKHLPWAPLASPVTCTDTRYCWPEHTDSLSATAGQWSSEVGWYLRRNNNFQLPCSVLSGTSNIWMHMSSLPRWAASDHHHPWCPVHSAPCTEGWIDHWWTQAGSPRQHPLQHIQQSSEVADVSEMTAIVSTARCWIVDSLPPTRRISYRMNLFL